MPPPPPLFILPNFFIPRTPLPLSLNLTNIRSPSSCPTMILVTRQTVMGAAAS